MTTKQGTLEKIEEAVNLDEVIKVAKIRQFNGFLRQGWVIPSVTSVAGIVVGLGVNKLWTRRKVDKIYEEANTDLRELQAEQLQLNFERAEKDREFNKAIANAAFVSQQLSEQGTTLLNALRHLNPGAIVGGEVTVPAPEEELVREVPQPKVRDKTDYTAPRVEDEPTAPEERPDGDRRLSKAVSTSRRVISSTGRAVVDAVEDVIEEAPRVVRNVFDNEDEWDYEAELSTRNPNVPYVLHHDEFMSDEMGYENQQTLTYYAGDDIMVDERERPIHKHQDLVGEKLPFGHGSGSNNVLYIRNERLEAEYEILLDPGKYTDMIAGEEIEREFATADLRHMNSPRRFRDD